MLDSGFESFHASGNTIALILIIIIYTFTSSSMVELPCLVTVPLAVLSLGQSFEVEPSLAALSLGQSCLVASFEAEQPYLAASSFTAVASS